MAKKHPPGSLMAQGGGGREISALRLPQSFLILESAPPSLTAQPFFPGLWESCLHCGFCSLTGWSQRAQGRATCHEEATQLSPCWQSEVSLQTEGEISLLTLDRALERNGGGARNWLTASQNEELQEPFRGNWSLGRAETCCWGEPRELVPEGPWRKAKVVCYSFQSPLFSGLRQGSRRLRATDLATCHLGHLIHVLVSWIGELGHSRDEETLGIRMLETWWRGADVASGSGDRSTV